MQSVILAAGAGSRLGDLTGGRPKCCLEIGGRTLVNRALDQFRRAGVREQIIVEGFGREQLRERCTSSDVRFAFNPFHRTTNTLASLWFGLHYVVEDFFLLNADTKVADQILDELASAPGEVVLACDRKTCAEEEVKYRTENGVIVELNKTMSPLAAEGEFLGLSRISAAVIEPLRTCVERLLARGEFQAYFEAAYEDLILTRSGSLRVLDVGMLPWCEIDFPADYERARALFEGQ
jgi:choline kinase